MFESYIQNEVLQKVIGASDNMWITCVPLHPLRLNVRGYNQGELLGRGIAQGLGMRANFVFMRRSRDTRPQFELKKEEREKNIQGAFELKKRYRDKIKGKAIFIVDDVFTSGATLRECGKILKEAGATQVFGLAFAMER